MREDRRAEVALLEGRVTNWTARLKRRFARTLGDDAGRIRFLPAEPNADFLQLLALADVVLDPFPFGGGNTSCEALAVGSPIVTRPSPFLRGRLTAALYGKMGWTDCIVDSAEQYIGLAVRLADDRSYHASVAERIRAASPVLFEDMDEVRDLESFIQRACDGCTCSPACKVSRAVR